MQVLAKHPLPHVPILQEYLLQTIFHAWFLYVHFENLLVFHTCMIFGAAGNYCDGDVVLLVGVGSGTISVVGLRAK